MIPGEDYYSFIRTDLWFTLPVGALVFIAICSTFYRYTHTEIESTRLLNKTVGGVLVMALLLWVNHPHTVLSMTGLAGRWSGPLPFAMALTRLWRTRWWTVGCMHKIRSCSSMISIYVPTI